MVDQGRQAQRRNPDRLVRGGREGPGEPREGVLRELMLILVQLCLNTKENNKKKNLKENTQKHKDNKNNNKHKSKGVLRHVLREHGEDPHGGLPDLGVLVLRRISEYNIIYSSIVYYIIV